MTALVLRPYQEGMREFAGRVPKCALWAEMGLGKTPTALVTMQDSLYDFVDTSRWLVVGPKLVVQDAWPRQLARWSQFRGWSWRHVQAEDFGLEPKVAISVHGKQVEIPYSRWIAMDPATRPAGRKCGLTFGEREDKAAVKRALQAMPETLHLVSWDFLYWLVQAYGRNWPYDGIVLDEAIFAQNSTADRHKAVWQVVHNLQRVHRLIELTGAPTPESFESLHGQIRLLDGGDRLGKTKTEFYDRWFVPAARKGHIVYSWRLKPGAREEMQAKLADITVSLKGYVDLPPMIVNPIGVSLPEHAQRVYRDMETEMVAELPDSQVELLAPSQAAKVGKLAQMANGAVYDSEKDWHWVHDAKLDKLEELMETVPGPILLAYQYEHDWQRIKDRFAKHAVHVHEKGALDRFRKGKVKLLCMHPASGAHGLDGLQDVSATAIWFGLTRRNDLWLQFNKRLHRDGQKAGSVVIHVLLALGTLEEYVCDDELPAKMAQQDWLLDALNMRLSHASPSVFAS